MPYAFLQFTTQIRNTRCLQNNLLKKTCVKCKYFPPKKFFSILADVWHIWVFLAFFIFRILYNLLANNFVDEQLKSRVRVAARQSRSSLKNNNANQASAWCSVYKCHLIESQYTQQRSSKPASNHRTHRYVYN